MHFLPQGRLCPRFRIAIELIRSTEEEKGAQIEHVRTFQQARTGCHERSEGSGSLTTLQTAARERRNRFAPLMQAVKYNSPGQIFRALYEAGGAYRRTMQPARWLLAFSMPMTCCVI
ncbi:MAG: hypothetical protein KGH73_02530 [Xanthomonadaceae bacterium]|nr:hypothetical protein [Xanthomonadaceae bacterium]